MLYGTLMKYVWCLNSRLLFTVGYEIYIRFVFAFFSKKKHVIYYKFNSKNTKHTIQDSLLRKFSLHVAAGITK